MHQKKFDILRQKETVDMEFRENTKTFVKLGYTDMRKQINGLSALIQVSRVTIFPQPRVTIFPQDDIILRH